MTQQEINQRSEAIAKFMEMKLSGSGRYADDYDWVNCPKGLHWPSKSFPPFDSSLDWLMPVAEKIESEGCIIEITLCLGKMCRITKGSFKNPVKTIANIESNSTKEAVFLAVSDYCLKEINQ